MFLIEEIRNYDIRDISPYLLEFYKPYSIFFSKNYLNKRTHKISTLSLFVDEYRIEKSETKGEIEINFSVFWNEKWNNLVLMIDWNSQEIILDRFLYNFESEKEYKGLGHYFMSFVKILALKLGSYKIKLHSTNAAYNFYKKEKFEDGNNEELIWNPKIELEQNLETILKPNCNLKSNL